MKKIEPELIPNSDMNILFYSVKITREKEFLLFLIDMAKSTISI